MTNCVLCDKTLSFQEKLHSKMSPPSCYPCWLYAKQEAEIKYGATGFTNDIIKMFDELIQERKA